MQVDLRISEFCRSTGDARLRRPLGNGSCRYCGDRVPAVTPTTFPRIVFQLCNNDGSAGGDCACRLSIAHRLNTMAVGRGSQRRIGRIAWRVLTWTWSVGGLSDPGLTCFTTSNACERPCQTLFARRHVRTFSRLKPCLGSSDSGLLTCRRLHYTLPVDADILFWWLI